MVLNSVKVFVTKKKTAKFIIINPGYNIKNWNFGDIFQIFYKIYEFK